LEKKIGVFKSLAWRSKLIIYFKLDPKPAILKKLKRYSIRKKNRELADKPGSVITKK